jgi:ribose 1,5-bisphosphokinase PhnN
MFSQGRVIALCGRRGAGKDFLSDALVARHGFVNLKFAGPIKMILSRLFDLGPDQIEGARKDEIDER